MSELSPSLSQAATSARTRAGGRHRGSRGRTWLIACLVLAALVGAAAARWWPSEGSERASLRTVVVAPGDVADVVSALGTLQPASYVDVGAQVSGQLTRLNAAIGDQVEQGQLLAELDARVLQSRLSTDTAELARLNGVLAQQVAQRELALAQANRQRTMFRGNATSRDQLDTAEAQVRILDAQIVQTKAEISGQEATIGADRANLSFTRIAAPMTGTVISVTAVQGQTLNANQSAPILLRIADLATMTVEVQVSEADQPKLRLGMPVRFNTLGRPDQSLTGTLRQIYPTPEVVNNVTLYTALFDVANADGLLLPQMSVQAFFIRAEANDVLLVPLATVSQGAGERTVQVVDSTGAIETRRIQLGVSDRVNVEVTTGLQAGDRIALKSAVPQDRPAGRPPFGPRL